MATDDEIIYKLMVNLPSPCVGEVDPLGFYDDLFAPLRRNGPIEGMVTPLYQYQRAAVARMLHQELYPPGYVPTLGKLPMDTYPPELRSEPISCSYGCGKHHYSPAVNPLTKDMKTSTDTTTVRTRGGILAEDPRSGKTLELLTLILLTKDQLACPTAIDVPFTRTACHLSYQAYLHHSHLSPYHYPGRSAKSSMKSDSGNESHESYESYESDIYDGMSETEPTCFPVRGVCAPLRYLALREVVHCPRLAGKALREFLPPGLQEFMVSSGFSYIEDRKFADTYYKRRNVTIPDNVKQHHQDLVFFTPATPNIRKFKGILESISFQRPKVWKRLRKAILVGYRKYIVPTPIPVQPSHATLVILPESSIDVWISEIKKHMAPGTLKYVTIQSEYSHAIAKLLKCDLVFISTAYLYNIDGRWPCSFDYPDDIRRLYFDATSHKPILKYLLADGYVIPNIYRILWKRVIVKDYAFTRFHQITSILGSLQSERRWLYLVPDSLVLDSEGDDPNQTRFSRKNFRGKSVTLSTYNLGQYFNGYLSIPPFNFGDLWGNVGMHLEEHPRRHNVSSLLNWVLTTYVVRNRSEDVRREIAIPPLTKRVIHLDCGHYEWYYYNFILADIIDCTVWEPYECSVNFLDQYHWWSCCPYNIVRQGYRGLPEFIISEILPNLSRKGYNKMKNVLEQPKKFGLNRIGTDLFRQCLRCIDLDLCDPTYRFNRNWFRTNYYIDIWPRSSFVFDTVSKKRKLLHGKLPDNDKTDMRPETENSPSDLSSNSTAILVDEDGLKVLANQLQLRHFYKHSDNVSPNADTMTSMLVDGESSMVMADDILLADSNPGLPDTNFESHRVVRPLAILGCSSAKRTYLANQLRLYSPYEKSVVYVNSKVDMKAVPAFLNLIGIKSVTLSHNVWYDCSHSGFCLPERDVYRPSYKNVVEFITNADCRVLVLPAWMAITGIDLTVASRIYFFSPVWYNTIEAEAIRRVHHMGQTRAVHVETLVIRDTVEELAFNFKGKPLYDGYRSSCKRKTNDNATDMDDLSNQDVDLSYNQEESLIDKTEDAKETADDTSPTQSTSGSVNHRLGPDIFFDEPIPLLSLRI